MKVFVTGSSGVTEQQFVKFKENNYSLILTSSSEKKIEDLKIFMEIIILIIVLLIRC